MSADVDLGNEGNEGAYGDGRIACAYAVDGMGTILIAHVSPLYRFIHSRSLSSLHPSTDARMIIETFVWLNIYSSPSNIHIYIYIMMLKFYFKYLLLS